MKPVLNNMEHYGRPSDSMNIHEFASNNNIFFSVLTYNTLADAYSKHHTYCPSIFLSFDYRKTLFETEIRNKNADFVCLQEVDHNEDFFKPCLSEIGYSSEYVKRPSPINPDGSLVAWKRDKWEAVDIVKINYNEHEKCSLDPSYIKNSVGILIVFRHRSDGKHILIGTSHFFWNPEFEHVKFLQGIIYCQKAYELKSKYNCPLVLTGDLNSEPDSYTVKYMVNMELDIRPGNLIENEILSLVNDNPIRLKSAYREYFNGSYPEFTIYKSDYIGYIDYLLYTEELEVVELGNLPNKIEFQDIEGIPNSQYPLIIYLCWVGLDTFSK